MAECAHWTRRGGDAVARAPRRLRDVAFVPDRAAAVVAADLEAHLNANLDASGATAQPADLSM